LKEKSFLVKYICVKCTSIEMLREGVGVAIQRVENIVGKLERTRLLKIYQIQITPTITKGN
jgi:hypothetical protein